MSKGFFDSSDSLRAARPLQHAKRVTFEEPLSLELGDRLPEVTVVYETYGQLNAARDNAVLVCHALSGDSHVARHHSQDDPGWWDTVVGPGLAIDTGQYYVLCANVLGGCRGTTGPNSVDPATGRRWGADFPTVTVGDMVEVQRRLIDHLGIPSLLAVVGGSMGGHQVLTWATRHPERVRGAMVLASSARLTSQALAFDVVGRNAIRRDPHFHEGQYYEAAPGPSVGLALARMLGHITYLSPQAMSEKFEADRLLPRDVPTSFEKKFSVGSYLAYQGDKFVERFDANSYMTLSMAMDLFDLGATPEELAENLAHSQCHWLVISYTSDWLFPAEQSQELVKVLLALNKPITYCNVKTSCGHDAFLLPDDLGTYGRLLTGFLANLEGTKNMPAEAGEELERPNSTSTFQPHRVDCDRIVDLIPPQASVLDLGCGRGELLTRLKQNGHGRLLGFELDEQALLTCVEQGLNVIQGDLDKGLPAFADRQFDVVVLSQTLQAVKNVELVLADLVRVGRKCIVSFSNFGYHKLAEILAEQGRVPEASLLLHFNWYNTPNLRFLTIADFEEFCAEKNIRIHQRIAFNTEEGREVTGEVNRLANLAIFVLSSGEAMNLSGSHPE
ncbi:MAG: homoserine O-acetyltransferase [Candidatus Latescibacteria bacterium]|nr:homoserine O-acetyltransferase [Candidatus Latescibacterota bacterium]